VLNVMSREKKPISEILKPLYASVESGEINFTLQNKEDSAKVMDELKQKFADGQLSTMDGISIEYPTWRFNVRSSNTEPLLRLNLEAKTREEMEKQRDEIIAFIKPYATAE
ncbi:MAG: phosphomannomutase/phosphoglucomutase, partial [Candidatus Levyibacteriota bacterium]